jgi:transposase
MQYAPVVLADQSANGLSCGIDWARDDHAIAIIDSGGRVIFRSVIEHSTKGLRDLIAVLTRHGVAEVAIERPDGPVVEALLDAGLAVVVINPNQIKNLRSRYGSAGNKDDRFDAFVLADTLRTDRARLRPLTPDSAATTALRALCRARKDLVIHRVRVANQLRAHLNRVYPGPVGLFDALDSPISLTFLTRFDCQDRADWLTPKRLGSWLVSVGYKGHTDPAVMHARLDARPRGFTGSEGAAYVGITTALVATLNNLVAQIAELSAQIGQQLPYTPMPTFSPACPAAAPCGPHGSWPKSVTAVHDSPHRMPWPAWPVWHPRPANPERCVRSDSAGPATNNSATPSATSPTTPATPTPGPPTSTTAPAPADTTTPTPPGFWPEPGCTSFGAAGKTTPPTTPPATEPSKPCSPKDSPLLDTGLLGGGHNERRKPSVAE